MVTVDTETAKAALLSLRLHQYELARAGRLDECGRIASCGDTIAAALTAATVPA